MAETIKWNFLVAVAGGPQITAAGKLDAEGYDKVAISVEKGTNAQTPGTRKVEIAPGAAGQFSLVVLNPDIPATPEDAAKLTYMVEGGTPIIPLDRPHVLLGPGAVTLLGIPTGAKSLILIFKNGSTTADRSVDVLVGRDATP